MPISTEFFRWWIVDERTGKRRRTTYAMTRADAAERFPGAEPDLQSREVHNLPDANELRAIARPTEPLYQPQVGHSSAKCASSATLTPVALESTVRYLGIEVDDALEISEQTEI